MHKWIAGSTCAAAVLSLAVASAQTSPPSSDDQSNRQRQEVDRATRRSRHQEPSGAQRHLTFLKYRSARDDDRMVDAGHRRGRGWMLPNASPSQRRAPVGSNAATSSSGSPSKRGARPPATVTEQRERVSQDRPQRGTSGARPGRDGHGGAKAPEPLGRSARKYRWVTSGATNNTSPGQSSTGNQSGTLNLARVQRRLVVDKRLGKGSAYRLAG